NSLVVGETIVGPPGAAPGWWVFPTQVGKGNYQYLPSYKYHGMVYLAFEDTMPLFNDGSGQAYFVFTDNYLGAPKVVTVYNIDPEFDGIPMIDNIVPNSGSPSTSNVYQYVYKRRPEGTFRRCTFNWTDSGLQLASDNPIAPDVKEPLNIS